MEWSKYTTVCSRVAVVYVHFYPMQIILIYWIQNINNPSRCWTQTVITGH